MCLYEMKKTAHLQIIVHILIARMSPHRFLVQIERFEDQVKIKRQNISLTSCEGISGVWNTV